MQTLEQWVCTWWICSFCLYCWYFLYYLGHVWKEEKVGICTSAHAFHLLILGDLQFFCWDLWFSASILASAEVQI